ncbi:MAG: exosortase system-associated protein, TIGR04073 family [Candidatus Omnitrophica bacterium]|nr:exosortase system-associated protein, TIGR04073 family [Candidatus Omnitrophota bacterium]
MHKKICFCLITFQLCLVPAYARDYNPLSKFARGLVNVTMGWLEIPRQMVKVKEAENHEVSGEIAGIFWGPLKGFTYFVGRAIVGIYEVGTFPIPTYKPLIRPEYIFADDSDE